MMTAEIAFFLFLAASLAAALWAGTQRGRAHALGCGIAVSFVAASWFDFSVTGLPLNVPTTVAAILMIAFCFHSPRSLFTSLGLIDVLMISLWLWHIFVDVSFGEEPLHTTIAAYGEWGLPYVAGRYAWLNRESLEVVAPWFAGAAALVGVAALLEAATSINLWESLADRDDRVSFIRSLRYDIAYRANGTTRHAIFLGVALMSMLPWAISIGDNSENSTESNSNRSSMGLLACVAIALGVFATISRGPILAVLMVAIVVACARHTTALWTVGGLVVTSLALLAVFPERMIDAMERQPGGNSQSTVVVMEDGEAVKQNSARNRLLVMQIYGPLVIKGGLMGYGTEAATGFPPRNLPGLTTDPQLLRQIGIVDNTFIGVGLRFGWVGLALFAALFITASATAFFMSVDAATFFYPHSRTTFVGLGIVIFALAMEMMTVYFDRDHAFWVLFLIGSVTGLQQSLRSDD